MDIYFDNQNILKTKTNQEYEETIIMNKEQTLTGVIRGTGACVPKRVMDNDEIAGFVETSDEWIRERTGVERRHIAEEETTVSMAVEAGRQAVEESGVHRKKSI